MVEERDDIIKDLSSKQVTQLPQQSLIVDDNLRNILTEAAKNSHVMGIKYKRLLKEYEALKLTHTNVAKNEEKVRNLELRLSLLESVEKRCFGLEQENESLSRKIGLSRDSQKTLELEKKLLDAQEAIDSLKEEFESINESNNSLISKVNSLEVERRVFQAKQNDYVAKIAELEKVNAALEDLLAKQ